MSTPGLFSWALIGNLSECLKHQSSDFISKVGDVIGTEPPSGHPGENLHCTLSCSELFLFLAVEILIGRHNDWNHWDLCLHGQVKGPSFEWQQ